MFSKKSDFKTD